MRMITGITPPNGRPFVDPRDYTDTWWRRVPELRRLAELLDLQESQQRRPDDSVEISALFDVIESRELDIQVLRDQIQRLRAAQSVADQEATA